MSRIELNEVEGCITNVKCSTEANKSHKWYNGTAITKCTINFFFRNRNIAKLLNSNYKFSIYVDIWQLGIKVEMLEMKIIIF